MRRQARWTPLAAVMLAALSCAPARKPPEVQEIVFWQSWPVEVVGPIVADFERAHPGLKVRTERLAAPVGRERILAALAADSVPDLCQIGSDSMPGLLAGNRLADWSAGVADLRPQLHGWELCSVGDALYGVPWVLDPRALFFNSRLLARAGLDPNRAPETWDELYRAAAAVQRLGRGVRGFGVPAGEPGVLREQLLPFLFANGGSILSADLRRAVFDSAANVEALEFLLRLRRVGRVARQDSIEREFLAGRLGFVLAGPRLLGAARRAGRGLRSGVALVPPPAARHAARSLLGGRRGAGLVQRVEAQAPRARPGALPGPAGERAAAGPGGEERASRRPWAPTPARAYRERPGRRR